MPENIKVLIVDDEKIALKNLEHVMKKEGYETNSTQSGEAALRMLDTTAFDVVLTDLRMEKVDGMKILRRTKELYPDAEVIMITGFATLESAVTAMKAGAFYYVAKPFKLDEVRKVVSEAAGKVRLKKENSYLRQQIEGFQGKVKIVTQDVKIKALIDVARQIAPTNCNVLITGESGTGKELFARLIHNSSARVNQPFVAVNCGAFNEELLVNELFGHEKGAFTGALTLKKGLIEAATGGTMFLDEITEMTPSMQVKLLRVIQEQELLRVGATEAIKIDVRFIAASNRDIQDSIKNGTFRQDLYYRINVVSLHIPPLSERLDDIPVLAYFFMRKYNTLMRKEVAEISQEVLSLFLNYDFPGNVRELENIIERGVALASGKVIDVIHMPEDLKELSIRTFRKKEGRIPTLKEQELEYIKWVMDEVSGNKMLAAQVLGIDRVSLWRKLKKFGMDDQLTTH